MATTTAPPAGLAPFDRESRSYQLRWWILGVLCLSLLVIIVDNSILNVAIPTLVKELGATNSQLQWMVDSYTLVFAGPAAHRRAAWATGSAGAGRCSSAWPSSGSARWPAP